MRQVHICSMFVVAVVWLCCRELRAQEKVTVFLDEYNDYRVIDEHGDTFSMVVLEEYIKFSVPVDPEREKYLRRLRYNVFKVYNYSITASNIMNEVDRDLADMASKKERRQYLRSKEKEYKKKYAKELQGLTMAQGQILVKLINRHTGKDAYSLIKELRGGVVARASQTAAYFFDNDLKSQYDPHGEDEDIEIIVQEIESMRSR